MPDTLKGDDGMLDQFCSQSSIGSCYRTRSGDAPVYRFSFSRSSAAGRRLIHSCWQLRLSLTVTGRAQKTPSPCKKS
eukprot:747574-Hanusia_phi.AAC.15